MNTKPTEVDLKKSADAVPGLICPFMSGQAVPVQAAGKIAIQTQTGIVSMMNPCARETCALFNTDSRTCCFNAINVSEIAGNIMRLADAFEKFDDLPSSIDRLGEHVFNMAEAATYIYQRVQISSITLDAIAASLVELGRKFDPPLNGISPLGSIANSLVELLETNKRTKKK